MVLFYRPSRADICGRWLDFAAIDLRSPRLRLRALSGVAKRLICLDYALRGATAQLSGFDDSMNFFAAEGSENSSIA
jgi:hypothetical protein